MDGSMRGPRAKIERAKKHVKELEVAIGALVFSHSANPDVILVEEDLRPSRPLSPWGSF